MELRKIYISDIGKIITGKTPRTSIADNYGGNIPFLTPSDDLTRKHIVKTGKTLSAKGLNEVKNCLIPEKSICVSCIGSDLGKVVMTSAPTVTNQQINSIVVKDEFDPDFIYYLMKIVGRELNFISKTSTAVPIINKSTFSNTEVFVPSLENQIRIGRILSSLDEKIENNRRINDNLEQQAQVLYKSWFVDFEPFKDGEFVESEMGEIPVGWTVVKFSDLTEIPKKTINPQKFPDTIFKHYSLPACDNGLIPEYQVGKDIMSNKIILQNNTTLFSKLNPRIKRIWFTCEVQPNSICSTEFIPYRATNKNESGYIFSIINSEAFYASVMGCVNGATGSHQRFHAEDTEDFLCAYNKDVVKKFSQHINAVLKQMHDLRQENVKLALMRDTLLPKLMSGELKINEIDC